MSASDLDPSEYPQLLVDEVEVKKPILSFPSGSLGGPDGFRPQHLKDLVQSIDSGSNFVSAIPAFVNMVLSGRCPSAIAPIFFGGRLIALNTKSGGIRLIAIGFTLRRLVSKCASFFMLVN